MTGNITKCVGILIFKINSTTPGNIWFFTHNIRTCFILFLRFNIDIHISTSCYFLLLILISSSKKHKAIAIFHQNLSAHGLPHSIIGLSLRTHSNLTSGVIFDISEQFMVFILLFFNTWILLILKVQRHLKI